MITIILKKMSVIIIAQSKKLLLLIKVLSSGIFGPNFFPFAEIFNNYRD